MIVPDEEPMVTTPVLTLVQVPPSGVSLNDEVEPKQMFGEPLIVAGAWFTVTLAETEQPVPSV